MIEYAVKPTVQSFDNCAAFCEAFAIGEGDLILTNSYIFSPAFDGLCVGADILYVEQFGTGEPSDEMVEAMAARVTKNYRRVIAIGGGTVLDIAKLFALKQITPVLDLFDKKIPAVKARRLVLVPTTCGTGSEMTNLSILALISRNTKLGLAADALYADDAVLIPGLLASMPWHVFAASSIDALIHAVESRVSPNATAFTKLLSDKAIEMIVTGYLRIAEDGREVLPELLGDFLLASNLAGTAFGIAGCGAVHALSYPIGGTHHVPHGEANYAVFTEVFKTYAKKGARGSFDELVLLLCRLLPSPLHLVFSKLDDLLGAVMEKKPLQAYGVTPAEIEDMAQSVMATQGRLMARNPVTLTMDDVINIYKKLY